MSLIVRSPNRAGDPDVQAQIARDLVPLLKRVREDKLVLNQINLRFWNIWAARHDSAAYNGRLRAYLATGRRVIENWVSMLKRGAFPVSGKWFEVGARTIESEERAPTVQSLFRRELTEYMAVRRKASPVLRGVVILGTQPLDIGWSVKAREVPTLDEIASGTGGSTKRLQENVRRVVEYLGPTLRPIDFFRWYMWPTTVNDLADADLCFEDFLQDPLTLERLSQTPIVPGREKGKDGLGYHIDPGQWAKAQELLPRSNDASGKLEERRRRLAARGFQVAQTKTDDPALPLDASKGFWHVQLPGDEMATWHEFVMAGDDVPLRMRQVSLGLLGQPSTLTPKFVEAWEEFYGFGLPTAFDSMQYFANDLFNQGGDALTWSLNPIAGVDPDMVQDHTTLQMKPGAKWLVRMPRQSIQWMEPPKESAQAALASVSQLVGLINDVGGVQPFAPGGKTTGKGRAVQTLGGLQILASEGQLQVADVLQSLEDLWFNPMLRRMYELNVQCLDEPMLLNVEGVRGAALIQTQVTRADLIGEFDFTWLASTYQYNAEVRSQQMIGFLQILSRIPPEVLAQNNVKFNLGTYLRMVYEEGLQLPSAQLVFQDAQPVRAIDAPLENELFLQGRGEEVHVSPADADDAHSQTHQAVAMNQSLPPEIRAQAIAHIQQHQIAKQVKLAMQQMQATGMLPPGQNPMGLLGSLMGGNGNGSYGGGGNGSDRLAQPDAPGRPMATSSIDDVARRQPRPGAQGPGGLI